MLGSTRVRLTPLKTPRQSRSRATYDSILDATARILEEGRGHTELTTNHIAERAGVGIGSLYEYFPNKETIIAEVARRTVRQMIQDISSGVVTAAELGGEAGLRKGVELLFDAVDARRDLVRALWGVPFLAQLAEVKTAPKQLLGLTRQFAPQMGSSVDANVDALNYLLTVMVGNAVVYAVTAPPRRLSRAALEKTLSDMLVRMLMPTTPQKARGRRASS